MDRRAGAARFYDLNPRIPDDVPFYEARVGGPGRSVLELGCGTGRVSIPLARTGAFVTGVDRSHAMLDVLRARLPASFESGGSVLALTGDISALRLGRTYDAVIAPFRVMQNLESDSELDGLFEGIRRHLAPGGRCILNAFHPNRPPDRMRAEWCSPEEQLAWRVERDAEVVACYDRRARIDAERLVLYPELVYRRWIGDRMLEEHTLAIAMRCHYPDELGALVERHGFRITGRWGGYAGEVWGRGPELVIEFGFPDAE